MVTKTKQVQNCVVVLHFHYGKKNRGNMQCNDEKKIENLNISFESDDFCCVEFRPEQSDKNLSYTNCSTDNCGASENIDLDDNNHKNGSCSLTKE